jgi:hypothetical protein
MFGSQRHYYIGLAVFIVLLSFTFFLFHDGDSTAYETVSKVPYRCPAPIES